MSNFPCRFYYVTSLDGLGVITFPACDNDGPLTNVVCSKADCSLSAMPAIRLASVRLRRRRQGCKHLIAPNDASELATKVGQRHCVDRVGAMDFSVRTSSVERPGRIAHEPRVETMVARHPSGCLYTVIGCGATDHDGLDPVIAEPGFEVRADEGAVNRFAHDRLASSLPCFILHREAGSVRVEGRSGSNTPVPNMNDRRAGSTESGT